MRSIGFNSFAVPRQWGLNTKCQRPNHENAPSLSEEAPLSNGHKRGALQPRLDGPEKSQAFTVLRHFYLGSVLGRQELIVSPEVTFHEKSNQNTGGTHTNALAHVELTKSRVKPQFVFNQTKLKVSSCERKYCIEQLNILPALIETHWLVR
jgi:hypothetical protein